MHLITERDSVDLSILLSHLQQGNIKKLNIGAGQNRSKLEMRKTLSHCYNLTHLSFYNQHVHKSAIVVISNAMYRGNLPFLSLLGLVKCDGLDKKLKLLFRSSWSQLIHLNLYGSPLDIVDYEKLSTAVDGKDTFPKLALLVVSVATISKQIFPHITNMTNIHGGLKGLFLDALTVDRSVQIIDAIERQDRSDLASFGVSLRWNILPKRLETNRPNSLASLGSLTLHNCIVNHDDLTTMIRHASLRRLSHLDTSRSLGIAGNLCVLLHYRFPSLKTLILSNCGLESEDLHSLADANVKDKLPRLQCFDVSKNYKVDGCLFNLFNRMCTWQGLLNLNLAETLNQNEQLDSFVSCIPSLRSSWCLVIPNEK